MGPSDEGAGVSCRHPSCSRYANAAIGGCVRHRPIAELIQPTRCGTSPPPQSGQPRSGSAYPTDEGGPAEGTQPLSAGPCSLRAQRFPVVAFSMALTRSAVCPTIAGMTWWGAGSLMLLASWGCIRSQRGHLPPIPDGGRTSSAPSSPALPSKRAPLASKTIGGSRDFINSVGITSPCVLHAGDSHTHRRERLMPWGAGGIVVATAECSFNAECVRQEGTPYSGDGFVGVECREQTCSCSFKSLTHSERAFGFSFQLAEPCSTTEMAEHLLKDRCMVGLALKTHDAGFSDGRRGQ